jgi:2-desacetyl-2-hydroxyethyl bacteriochlorophyllide A dehydrogenase
LTVPADVAIMPPMRGGAGTMRAAVFHGVGDLRVEEVPVPTPRDDEVLLRVEACGICGTDVHILKGTFPPGRAPITLGHEFAGRVVDGDGRLVTADIATSCGGCFFCRHGQRLFCPEVRQIGVHRDGAFAEYVAVPTANLHALPPGMTARQGAYVEPLACVLHGHERAAIAPGSSVVVVGAGPMGLLHVQLARLRGAARVVCSEPHPGRRRAAERLGADVALDPGTDDAVAAVLDLTAGRGADLVIEAAGTIPTYRDALRMVRRAGTLLAFGAAPAGETLPFSPFDLYARELTLVGSYAATYGTYEDAIALIAAGRVEVDATVTAVRPLAEIGDAIAAAGRDPEVVKIQISLGDAAP